MKILRFNPSTTPSTLLEGCCFAIVLCLQGLSGFFTFVAIPDFVGFLPSRALGMRVSYRPCSPKKPPRRSRDKQVQRVHPRTVWTGKGQGVVLYDFTGWTGLNKGWRGSLNRSLARRRVVPGRHTGLDGLPPVTCSGFSFRGPRLAPSPPRRDTHHSHPSQDSGGDGRAGKGGFLPGVRNPPKPADPPGRVFY